MLIIKMFTCTVEPPLTGTSEIRAPPVNGHSRTVPWKFTLYYHMDKFWITGTSPFRITDSQERTSAENPLWNADTRWPGPTWTILASLKCYEPFHLCRSRPSSQSVLLRFTDRAVHSLLSGIPVYEATLGGVIHTHSLVTAISLSFVLDDVD